MSAGFETFLDQLRNGLAACTRLHEVLAGGGKMFGGGSTSDSKDKWNGSFVNDVTDKARLSGNKELFDQVNQYFAVADPLVKKLNADIPKLHKYLEGFSSLQKNIDKITSFRKEVEAYPPRSSSGDVVVSRMKSKCDGLTKAANDIKVEVADKVLHDDEIKRAWQTLADQYMAHRSASSARAKEYNKAVAAKRRGNLWMDQGGSDDERLPQAEFDETQAPVTDEVLKLADDLLGMLNQKLADVPGGGSSPEERKKAIDEARKGMTTDAIVDVYRQWRDALAKHDSSVGSGVDDDKLDWLTARWIYNVSANGPPQRGIQEFLGASAKKVFDMTKKPIPGVVRGAQQKASSAASVASIIDANLMELYNKLTQLHNDIMGGRAGDDANALSILASNYADAHKRAGTVYDTYVRAVTTAQGKTPVTAASLAAASGGMAFGSSGSKSSSSGAPHSKSPMLSDTMEMSAPSFLYRHPDKDAFEGFYDQLERFHGIQANVASQIAGDMQGSVVDRATRHLATLQQQVQALRQSAGRVEPARVAYEVAQTQRQKVAIMERMCTGARTVLARFQQMHADFALKTHRDGLRYMGYWQSKEKALSGEAKQLLDQYMSKLKEVKEEVAQHLKLIMAPFAAATAAGGSGGSLRWGDGIEDDALVDQIADDIDAVLEYAERVEARVRGMYEGSGPSVRDIVFDGQFILMYAVKLLRVMFMWLALFVAERVFRGLYANKVYGQNADPPHPIVFVGMAVAMEMAANVGLLVLMALLKFMFDTPHSSFPINGAFLVGYCVDYVSSTAVLMALGGILSSMVRNKKYFRYKYEGERGIRALQTMVFNMFVLVDAIPFFRLVA